MPGKWVDNYCGVKIYQPSEEEIQESKIITSKKILDWWLDRWSNCNHTEQEDSIIENCPFLQNTSCRYSMIEKVNQLIKFRDKIPIDRKKNIYHYGELPNIVQGYVGFNYRSGYSDSRYIYFSEFLDLFYKEYPEAANISSNSIIDTLVEKTRSMEQFQAQILDKLTVFAEMIDEMQKTPIKVIDYKSPNLIQPLDMPPPDYVASLDGE